jgi:hypothetical protein
VFRIVCAEKRMDTKLFKQWWSKEFQTHGEAFYDAWAEKIGSVCDEIYSAVYAD